VRPASKDLAEIYDSVDATMRRNEKIYRLKREDLRSRGVELDDDPPPEGTRAGATTMR
jgi:hypothetical protein